MFDSRRGDGGAGCRQAQVLIVESGAAISGGQFDNNEIDTGFLEITVGTSVGAEQFGSSHLEPDGVNGVVDDPGLVCFAISRDDSNCVAVCFHFPLQFHKTEDYHKS